jgi:hypothetical protein
MVNQDVVDLYRRVPVGSRVIVMAEGVQVNPLQTIRQLELALAWMEPLLGWRRKGERLMR